METPKPRQFFTAVDMTDVTEIKNSLEMLDNWSSSNSRKIDDLQYKVDNAEKRQIQRDAAIDQRLTRIETVVQSLKTAVEIAVLQPKNPKLDKVLTDLADYLNRN